MTDFSEPTTATGSTWIRCFSPDGYQMALTLPITSVADALRHLADIRAAGLTATLPGLKTGELSGTITSCMKREKQNRDGSITPIIDMYGPWEGEFGRYRFVGVYLNTPEDVAEFEANSGLKIKNMPLFDSQVPLQRTAGITHKCEVKCQPFEVVKKEDAMKEIGGEMKMTYELARYVSTSATPPAAPQQEQTPAAPVKTPPPPSTPSPDGMGFTRDTAFEFVSHWFKKETLSTESILKALGIEGFGDWKQSVADAHARVALAVQALKGHDAPADAPLAANGQRRH
jgi:hypothetical protein